MAKRKTKTKRIYRTVETHFWLDAKILNLSSDAPNARTLFLYLLTGPETCLVPGLLSTTPAAVFEALGWDYESAPKRQPSTEPLGEPLPERFKQPSPRPLPEPFCELVENGLIEYDDRARLVWVKQAVSWSRSRNMPANPNIVASWADAVETLPECLMLLRAMRHILSELQQRDEAPGARGRLSDVFADVVEDMESRLSEAGSTVPQTVAVTVPRTGTGTGTGTGTPAPPTPQRPIEAPPAQPTAAGGGAGLAGQTDKSPGWLERLPADQPLTGDDIETALGDAQLGSSIGARTTSVGRLLALQPILAGELRLAIGEARNGAQKRNPGAYLAAVVQGLRDRGGLASIGGGGGSSAGGGGTIAPDWRPEPGSVQAIWMEVDAKRRAKDEAERLAKLKRYGQI